MTKAQQIEQFALLENLTDGWDVDGVAPAPSPLAIDIAKSICKSVKWQPYDIDADAMGGVCLMFAYAGKYVTVCVFNSGYVSVSS